MPKGIKIVRRILDLLPCTLAANARTKLTGLRPTAWVVMSSIADLLIISTLATRSIAMAPLPMSVVACEFAAAIAFFLILDTVKIPAFARLGLS